MNKRLVIAACAAMTALCTGLLPVTFGTPAFWGLLMVGGAASAGMYTVALGELGDRFSGHELTTGTACFSTTWGVGALIGALGTGLAFNTFGPDGMPYGLALVMASFFVVMLLSLQAGRHRA
jgi:predicted MFS family arabinose efflux permease